ncbi:Hsp33 family molecular chaperone HslO [Oceanisphaera psychrotolerans]|uniref:33 kDa chaperonin n=1 Tax=Oceanisphaera psychrotolerans TaxID=1414654 RepID=A0A1J4QAW0_9GAMM|nr:Hsp33 family molecular chaperone HslO [Oceanisphaera psychrotolerans]OIN05560.1 Hsp33 family molecular chaperone [Oceanisphaera psychrotolerans]
MTHIDQLHRYLFDNYQVRGELVQLQQSLHQVLASQAYPTPVKRLLGELLTATSLLTATLKFEGHITVQLQGDGPVSMAVINGDHQQHLRGVARWEGEVPDSDKLADIVGKGYLAITITPFEGERYQGIVELGEHSLSESLENYFAQSEQLNTRIWLFTDLQHEQPRCAGMLLQALPGDQEGDFTHLEALTHTIKADELMNLDAHEILYRLYHQEAVRVFDPQPVRFQCTCSREKCEQALLQVGQEEARDIVKEEGKIEMHCDYCGNRYHFNEADLQSLFNDAPTLH